ncbi:hypothetical protein QYB59_000381 [Clostridium perfringens]|nr:hypothetical protein [Clostridium perfringens]
MKLLDKLGITFFIIIAIIISSYFFMPIKLEAAFNMLSENPKLIVITEKKENEFGGSEFNSYKIDNDENIKILYNDLKEIKIVRTLKESSNLNEYNIYMGEEYIRVSLMDDFIKVEDETFRVVDSENRYKELLSKIKENFIE